MAELGIGRELRLRVGQAAIATIDSIRFGHVLAFARATGQPWPTLEFVARHPDGDEEVDWEALVDELQRLAQQRPPEHLAPAIGLLRNDATRAAMLAGRGRGP